MDRKKQGVQKLTGFLTDRRQYAMTRLNLFTVFHLNLMYSSIEEKKWGGPSYTPPATVIRNLDVEGFVGEIVVETDWWRKRPAFSSLTPCTRISSPTLSAVTITT